MYRCDDCGAEYPPAGPWRCECGHALDYATVPLPDSGPLAPADLDRERGLWAFESFLPVERGVTLGEGWTPLVAADGWNAQFKLEYLFPTGSFKDRGAATTISQAQALGVDRVVEDSSGNAGLAIATYAARADIDAEIYVPADAKPGKLNAIERTGADVVRVEGSRADVTEACVEAVEAGEIPDSEGGWYASHAWNPAFFAGTMTWALELAAQRDWAVPDAVVTPLGHGTLFLGASRGFRALERAGWIDEIPRLLGAQAVGYAPFETADSDREETSTNDEAAGIQITEPARADQIRHAIDATDGEVVAVDAAATAAERDRLARAGFHVEATSATATAALTRFRETGVVDSSDDVVVALTGSGLKG